MLWDKPGMVNTENTLELAVNTGIERGINHFVVASNEGETIFKLLEFREVVEFNLVCVTHQVGFRKAGSDEMPEEVRRELREAGVKVYTGTHLLGGVDRSLRKNYGGLYPPEIIANTLRLFGQGVKVCLEISIMALDAGLIPFGEEIIAIGGTGRGADTAAVLKPAHAENIFDSKIIEIICRPGN